MYVKATYITQSTDQNKHLPGHLCFYKLWIPFTMTLRCIDITW